MAENKKGFVLYADLIHTVEKLPDEKAGELFKHILDYVNDKNPQTDDLIINISFEPIKQQLKRDLEKYYKTCERNKINGSKGGRPKNPTEPKKPTGLNGNPTEPKKPDTDKDTDKDSDIDKEIINKIYNVYPSKCPIKGNNTGKSLKDKHKIKKLLVNTDKEKLISTINLYIEDCKTTKTYIKNFSTFLNNIPDYDENIIKTENSYTYDIFNTRYKNKSEQQYQEDLNHYGNDLKLI